MTHWTPLNQATIDHGKRYWVAWQDEREPTLSQGNDVSQWRSLIAAVMECTPPEPYVPPKPKRREWGVDDRGYPLPCGAVNKQSIIVREVLPGDCDPDVVREVVADLRSRTSHHFHEWADRLEGKQ